MKKISMNLEMGLVFETGLVFVELPLFRIVDGPGQAAFHPFGAVGRSEGGGAGFDSCCLLRTP
jgi:hypothetical protein